MLICEETSSVIALPTKCGYYGFHNSVLYPLEDRLKGLNPVRPVHGTIRLSGYKNYVLITRDPLSRSVSQYWYCQVPFEMKKISREIQASLTSYNRFMTFMASGKSGAVMLRSQRNGLKEFRPTCLLDQGDIESRWLEFLPSEGLARYKQCSKHPTKGKKSLEQTLKRPLSRIALEWLEAEYEALKIYDVKAARRLWERNEK